MIQSMWTNSTTNLLQMLSTWINRNSMCLPLFLDLTFVLSLPSALAASLIHGILSRKVFVPFYFRFVTLIPIEVHALYYPFWWKKNRSYRILIQIRISLVINFLVHSVFFYVRQVCRWMQMGVVNAQCALYCSLCSLPLICKAFVQIKCWERKMWA